jgi:hypothetical protein
MTSTPALPLALMASQSGPCSPVPSLQMSSPAPIRRPDRNSRTSTTTGFDFASDSRLWAPCTAPNYLLSVKAAPLCLQSLPAFDRTRPFLFTFPIETFSTFRPDHFPAECSTRLPQARLGVGSELVVPNHRSSHAVSIDMMYPSVPSSSDRPPWPARSSVPPCRLLVMASSSLLLAMAGPVTARGVTGDAPQLHSDLLASNNPFLLC